MILSFPIIKKPVSISVDRFYLRIKIYCTFVSIMLVSKLRKNSSSFMF
jgi:hypothetical protein